MLSDIGKNPCRDVARFVAQIIIVSNASSIRNNSTPIVYCNLLRSPCCVQSILATVDKKTGEVIQYAPEQLKIGESALVELVPMRPFPVEDFAYIPAFGRLVFQEHKQTIAVGVVKEVVKMDQ